MMTSIISRENIILEKIQNVKEGKLVLELFHIAEQLGIGEEIELQNNFTSAILEYMKKIFGDVELIRFKKANTIISNIYYVTELYLRGYWAKETYIRNEEFLSLVKYGKTERVIELANESFNLHMNRLKKIIAKSKKKLPKGDIYYKDTLSLLKELDKDVSLCANYPDSSIDLTEFYFAKYYGESGPVMLTNLTGILALEEYIYSLYNELCILSKLSTQNIHEVCNDYIMIVGNLQYNLFEKVINNCIFSMAYSDGDSFIISKVDAELLMKEMKQGTITATELIDQLIDKYGFDGYKKEYLKRYEKYLENRIKGFREIGYFAELFLIAPD